MFPIHQTWDLPMTFCFWDEVYEATHLQRSVGRYGSAVHMTGNIRLSNVMEIDVCNRYNHASAFQASECNVFPLQLGCSKLTVISPAMSRQFDGFLLEMNSVKCNNMNQRVKYRKKTRPRLSYPEL